MRRKFKGQKLPKLDFSKGGNLEIITPKNVGKIENITNLVIDLDVKSVGTQEFVEILSKIEAKHKYYFLEGFNPKKFKKYGGKFTNFAVILAK